MARAFSVWESGKQGPEFGKIPRICDEGDMVVEK